MPAAISPDARRRRNEAARKAWRTRKRMKQSRPDDSERIARIELAFDRLLDAILRRPDLFNHTEMLLIKQYARGALDPSKE